jgi:adenosylhomocysteine nucleosidase
MHARRWAASQTWHHRTKDALWPDSNPETGVLLTADRLAASAADKAGLAAQWGAVAVDMESAAVAAVAHELDVPFLCVRAIADPAEMALPRALLRATDAAGAVRRVALLGELLGRPGDVGTLLRLASHFRAALRTLARAADRMGTGMLLGARGA